jgi:hypothetical protein
VRGEREERVYVYNQIIRGRHSKEEKKNTAGRKAHTLDRSPLGGAACGRYMPYRLGSFITLIMCVVHVSKLMHA